MKKILAIPVIVFLLLISMLTGCSAEIDTSPEYNPETDYNVSYENYSLEQRITETEDGFYYTSDHIRFFIDKTTMKSVALCNKPNCTHTFEDMEMCGGYIGGILAPECLYSYQGKLYGFAEEHTADKTKIFLCEIEKDGTSYKKIWEMKWNGRGSERFQQGLLHRGVYYFYTISDPTPEQRTFSVYAYDLQTKKCKRIYDDPNHNAYALTAIGNFLYWEYSGEITENGQILEDPIVMQYEISSGKISKIKNGLRCFAGGDKVFFEEWDPELLCRRLNYMNRDGTGYTETDVLLQGPSHADDRYIYSFDYRDNSTVDVLDINTLTLVAELDVSKVSKEYNATFLLPGSEDIIFLYRFYAELDPIFYAYKSDIGTPDFQWYKIERVN